MLPPSPCIGVCRLTDQGICTGCGRTAEEIAGWRSAPSHVTERIWAELPDRRKRLGLTLHRLGWGGDDIRRFAAATLVERWGDWVFRSHDMLAAFGVADSDEEVECTLVGPVVTAATARGGIRLDISEQARVMVMPDAAGGVASVALVVASAARPGPQSGVTISATPARPAVSPLEAARQLRAMAIPDAYIPCALFRPYQAALAAVNAAFTDPTRFTTP